MLNSKVRILLTSFILLGGLLQVAAQEEFFYEDNRTPTYSEVIAYFQRYADASDKAKLLNYGTTDAGEPLHLLLIDDQKKFKPSKDRAMVLIMNDIHAGESCGVDASMNLIKELLSKRNLPSNVIIGIIPIYNVGGALNRNSHSRANQNGPVEHGFRGNARNLDLNRDFIKCDSRNAKTFTEIFQLWKPHVFVDTHTSNGADYQYVFTLISTQKDKLNPVLKPFLKDKIEPFLYKEMKESGFEMIPYVNSVKNSPDKGIAAFLDRPRYSTGYAALFNTIGFTSEAHMFKTYEDRVNATQTFLESIIHFADGHSNELIRYKQMANRMSVNTQSYQLDWELDTSVSEPLEFKGYKAAYKRSLVTGAQRLYYDRSRPYTDSIPYFTDFRSTLTVKRPRYFILSGAWEEAIERLKLNKIQMQKINRDTSILVKVYYIENYTTNDRVYESHYQHGDVEIREEMQSINFHKGDFLIPMGQVGDNYTMTVLDPRGPDSFFSWNFFDEVLQQKEWFSPYVFEESAKELLESDPLIKADFEKKKLEDKAFAKDPVQQLYYLYKRSKHYEKEHMRYPVFRID